MKYLLSITLLATLLLFTSASDDGAKCVKATRSSLFPYGDERARADFCVRLTDILSGFASTNKFVELIQVQQDDAKLNDAVNATQSLTITANPDGSYSGVTAELDNAYAKWKEVFNFDKVDVSTDDVGAAVRQQLLYNNLVVKNTLVDDAKTEAKKFAEANFEELYIAGRVASKLEELKREQTGAENSVNSANSGLKDFFDALLHTVTSQMAIITERRTGTGKVTSTDIEQALESIQEKVSTVNDKLKNSGEFANQVLSSIEGNLELSRQFELLKKHATDKVSEERGIYIGKLENLMVNAWENFERLSDTSDATFDPNA